MSSPRPLRLLLGVAVALLGVCATGCATSFKGLEFHNDNRMTVVSPKADTLVKLPATLQWRMQDFTVAGPHRAPVNDHFGYFAIFVDRSPVKPGQTLAAVNSSVASCQHGNLCNSRSYLANEQIYTTTKDHLKLQTVSDLPGNNLSEQYHTATIVLMNTAGHRIGESAWSVEFKLHASELQ